MKIFERIVYLRPVDELDEQFYKTHYRDLSDIDSIHRLRRHYREHGKSEGRFPNEQALVTEIERIKNENPQFNLPAYKYYNPDLLRSIDRDVDFVLHYARHGKQEGRRCSFETERVAEQPGRRSQGKLWEGIFSPPQAMAWFGDALHPPPGNRQEAIAAFVKFGIDKLWPIEFGFLFDPEFYRSVAPLADARRLSAGALYRHWLEKGVESGIAPNPEAYLYAYLGGAPYPEDFDWKGYAAHQNLPQSLSRYDVLKTAFEAGSLEPGAIIPYLKKHAHEILVLIGKHALANGRHRKAVDALNAAQLRIPDANALCLLGDAYRGNGNFDRALACYRKSIAAGDAPIWSYFNAVDILFADGDFSGGFDELIRARKPWGHKIEFCDKVDACVATFFERASAQGHAAYREDIDEGSPDLRRKADAIIEEALDRIKAVYEACDNLPAPTGGSKEGYVALLANDDLRQCTHYRIEQKILQFEAAGVPIRFFSHGDVPGFLDSLTGARAAIFYRVAALPEILRAILHAKAMALPTFYEIDDIIFDSTCYPDSLESFEGQISREEHNGLKFGVPLFRYAMAECDQLIASTTALAEQMKRLTGKKSALVVRNALDRRNRVAIEIGSRANDHTSDRVRIFYGSGTKAHNADFNDLVGPALVQIMRRRDNVDLVVVGHLKLRPELAEMAERVKIYPFVDDITAYWSLLAACDINLAVLHAGVVADCKSEIKWLEAAVLRVPSVVTDTATYREVIEPGIDGLLATSPADWLRDIEALVNDADLRLRLGDAAREKALKLYDLERSARIWKKAFAPAKAPAPGKAVAVKQRMRVMICNVFYHPQSIGGATRVVEDNVRSLRALYDDIEIAVFCSNEGDAACGRMHMGHFDDVRVYRIATPIEEGMDWRPFNDANKPLFERALDDFCPDIVHFHCIQRLTASIVEVTLAREIPYVVTLHDGWWISDYQFLVDPDGFLQLPTTDVLADCAKSRQPLKSIERRLRLRVLLDAADARLPVSAPFAQVYADAGIGELTIVENGIPGLTPAPRWSRGDGRVAMGHIGGRAAHKGAYLIEAALRQGDYRNLRLTMIDGAMPTGQAVQTTWGGTPVTLCGPWPQSRIAELYAGLNVLLAPSTWPESYGLVTREALSLGLWVVASDRGAIGQSVAAGENGFLIDTRTAKELRQTFEQMNGNPARYRSAPGWIASPVRTMADQARDLHQIYAGLVAGESHVRKPASAAARTKVPAVSPGTLSGSPGAQLQELGTGRPATEQCP